MFRALVPALGMAALVAAGETSAPPTPVPKPVPAPAHAAAARPTATPTPKPLVGRFRLFPVLDPHHFSMLDERLELVLPTQPARAFHQAGDPDSLFTFGGPTPDGELRLKAALEVNDVILRAIAPDGRVDPSDTRFRAAGDYRALDARGRPYQLRLGARIVW